jgi:NitT/TauT family transport system permease protein
VSKLLIPLFLILWQVTASSKLVSPLLMPPLDAIAAALWRDVFHGVLLQQLSFSLLLVAGGALLGASAAWILALFASLGGEAKKSVTLLSSLLHPLPGIALLPLVVIWVGIGTPAVLLVMVHSALWPVFNNLRTGLEELPPRYREMAENWELSASQKLIHIIIPALFPYFLSGLRTGWARSWRALVAAEMVFGAAGFFGGIGWYIFERRVYMDSAGLYAGLFLIMAAGLVVDVLAFGSLERFTGERWGRSVV